MAYLSYIWDAKTNTYVNVGGTDYTKIYYDTTAGWNEKMELISQERVLYIYTDGNTYEDETGTIRNLPSMKIGDGTSYLIDLPAISTNAQTIKKFKEHANDAIIHISDEERKFWNQKCRVDESLAEYGILVLTTD